MGRMAELANEQEEQENLSGADDYEAWIVSIEKDYKFWVTDAQQEQLLKEKQNG